MSNENISMMQPDEISVLAKSLTKQIIDILWLNKALDSNIGVDIYSIIYQTLLRWDAARTDQVRLLRLKIVDLVNVIPIVPLIERLKKDVEDE